jgi:hypothetical protein
MADRRRLAGGLVLMVAVAAGGTAHAQCTSKTTSMLQQHIDAASSTEKLRTVFVMQLQPDYTTACAGKTTQDELLHCVVQALWDAKEYSRTHGVGDGQPLVDELAAQGSTKASNIQSLWGGVNAVLVDATKDVITTCAGRSDVVIADWGGMMSVTGDSPSPGSGGAIQPNIHLVNADAVWPTTRGAGVVVGVIGTGGPSNHVDLQNVFKKDDNVTPWFRDMFDATQTTPIDDHGLSTHLLGIAVGGNGYGVAPDAKWMACRAAKRNATTGDVDWDVAHIIDCNTWMLNPDERFTNGTPDPIDAHVPNVLLFPYTNPFPATCFDTFHEMIRAWRKMNRFPVVSTGDGPEGVTVAGQGVPVPGSYPDSFTVGAADQTATSTTTTVAGSTTSTTAVYPQRTNSYRGVATCLRGGLCLCGDPGCAPETCTARRAVPAVLAPGVEVESAWIGSSTDHKKRSGSDVAAAHVAGAAALIYAKYTGTDRPAPEYVDRALQRSAAGFTGLGTPTGFTDYVPGFLDVARAIDFRDSEFVSQEAPPCAATDTCTTGVSYTASVTMRNTGVVPWTSADVELAANSTLTSECGTPQYWLQDGTSDVLVQTETRVVAGQTAGFETGHSPNRPGLVPYPGGPYPFAWRLRRRDTLAKFGATSTSVPVSPHGTDNAQLALYPGWPQAPANQPPVTPCSIAARACGYTSLRLVNTGSTKWAKATYAPAELDSYGILAPAFAVLDRDVCPYENGANPSGVYYLIPVGVSSLFQFCGPSTAGQYRYRFEMRKSGAAFANQIREDCTNTIGVSWGSQFVGWSPALPALLHPGQSVTSAAQFKNTGTTTWSSINSGVHLFPTVGSPNNTATQVWPDWSGGSGSANPDQIAAFQTNTFYGWYGPGRWRFDYDLWDTDDNEPTPTPYQIIPGGMLHTFIKFVFEETPEGQFTGNQGGASGLWTYRFYNTTNDNWPQMNCSGSACTNGTRDVRLSGGWLALTPGDTSGVSAMWKAAFDQTVTIGYQTTPLGGTCGNGARVRVLHYYRNPTNWVFETLDDQNLPPGGSASRSGMTANVKLNDTVRFVVTSGGSNNSDCDQTGIKGTIYAEPPDTLEGRMYPNPPGITTPTNEPN